ncbi:MAG: hypothetical protein OXF03_10390, partial [Gammaproteobacteria bacterium]|nr:hypothetical protein [Gammaproteobacteria bacterium]
LAKQNDPLRVGFPNSPITKTVARLVRTGRRQAGLRLEPENTPKTQGLRSGKPWAGESSKLHIGNLTVIFL